MPLKIAVVGGGIVGFSCAVQIAEFYKSLADVIVISEDFSPNTTGDGAAGLWGPFLINKVDSEKFIKWSKKTHDFLHKLWLSEEANEAGVCLIPVIRVTTAAEGINPFWRNEVFGYHHLDPNYLQALSKQYGKNFIDGVHCVTFTSEPLKLLPYLMKRFQNAGGNIQKTKIHNLKEFVHNSNYDIYINCVGLNAKYIVPDPTIYSIRGQVSRFQAPWIYFTFLDESDDGNYIIPNYDSVVLGGTHQVNDYNTQPDPSDREFIETGCKKILPGLSNAKKLKEWVGLRPGRPSVRLEKEICDGGKIIIHNYGHGGSGVTLSWGCASNVLDILNENKSKL